MKLLRDSQGIAIIYVTLFLMVLGILFFALGVDIGWMVYVKSQGQKATDASALSGAAAIPNANGTGTKTEVDAMATAPNINANAVMNTSAGITGANVELCDGDPNAGFTCGAGVSPTKAGGVRVTRTYNTPLLFTRFVNGAGSTNLSVASIAWLGGPGSCPGCLPVAVCDQEIHYTPPTATSVATCDPTIPIHFSPTGVNNGAWWNDPTVGSTSAQQCKDMVNGVLPPPATGVGGWIDLNNGQVNSCLKAIQDRFMDPPNSCNSTICSSNPDPVTDPVGYARKQACTAYLPVVHCSAGSPIQFNTPIMAFVGICIDSVSTQGSNKILNGTLNCNVTMPGSIGGGTFFGVYAAKPVLVR